MHLQSLKTLKRIPFWGGGVAISLLLAGAMGVAAQKFDHREFFFPELLAMAMGFFWMGGRPWRATRPMIFVTLVLGGLLGWGLSLLPGLGVSEKMLIGYALCGCWLAARRINVTPMFSACLLPLLLNESSWFYPAAIAVQMALLCGIEWGLERYGVLNERPFEPLEGTISAGVWRWFKLTAILGILLWSAGWIGFFVAAPPLIVAYSVFADLYRPARKHCYLALLTISAAALIGGGTRLVALRYGISEVGIMAGAIVIFAFLCRSVRYYLPPSAAVLLLAFLVPQSMLMAYLWQIPVGALLFVAAGRIFSLAEERS